MNQGDGVLGSFYARSRAVRNEAKAVRDVVEQ